AYPESRLGVRHRGSDAPRRGRDVIPWRCVGYGGTELPHLVKGSQRDVFARASDVIVEHSASPSPSVRYLVASAVKLNKLPGILRLAVLGALAVVYSVAFLTLEPRFGLSALQFDIVPLAAAGVLLGARAGLRMGLLLTVLNVLLHALLGRWL